VPRCAAASRSRGCSSTPPLEEIIQTSERVGLTLVQLHGDEGPAYCTEVARRTGARTIKAAPVQGLFTLHDLERFHTDFHLLDGYVAGERGGTGQAFDWSLVSARRTRRPLIVGGGLDADTVAAAIEATSPFAVDVAGGVEAAPGIKDPTACRPSSKPRRRASREYARHRYGPYGGQLRARDAMPALVELESAWLEAWAAEDFRAELALLLRDFAGRPTPL